MPSLVTLVADRQAKLEFASSPHYRQSLQELSSLNAAQALSVLTLAAREPAVAQQLKLDLPLLQLESLFEHHTLNALRLVDAISMEPSPCICNKMAALLNKPSPSIDEISGAQIAAKICKRYNIRFDLELAASPPQYVAAQVATCHNASSAQLWKLARSSNTRLRLAAVSILADREFEGLLPFVADLIPHPEACAIAVKLIDEQHTAPTLVDTGVLSKLLKSPSKEGLLLGAALAEKTNMLGHGELELIQKLLELIPEYPIESLSFLLVLTRRLYSLRQGSGIQALAEAMVHLVQHATTEIASQAMAVACNLVRDVSPCCSTVLPLYKVAVDRLNDANSVWFLAQATAATTIDIKAKLFWLMGVERLLQVCNSEPGLALLSNLLDGNPSAVQVWLSEAPLDLWAMVDNGLRLYTEHTLWVLNNIAAAHPKAILERPNLMNRIAQVLDTCGESSSNERRLAGVLLLSNLFQGTPVLARFRRFLEQCRVANCSLQRVAETLLGLG